MNEMTKVEMKVYTKVLDATNVDELLGVTFRNEVSKEIAKKVVKRFKLESEKDVDALYFEAFEADGELKEYWVEVETNFGTDVTYDLDTAEETGSGGVMDV